MMSRLLNFAGKARRRGFDYVGAISTYQAHVVRYRVVALSGQKRKRIDDQMQKTSSAPVPPFHFSPSDISAIVAAIPDLTKRAVILEADRYLEQKFRFRGLAEVEFPEGMDWNFAPNGNLSWSWDLNRHPYFLTLGAAYHFTRNAAYVEKVVALWDDWMRQNPPAKGLNWRSPFEVAARLRNWIWTYFLLAAAQGADSPFLHNAFDGLCEHAAFLSDHLEYHWPNNQLLLEALSLCEFALVFCESGGEQHLTLASKIIAEQMEQQVLADGVHGELCPMYHEIVATELNVFARLCRKLQFPLGVNVAERIAAMQRFSFAMRRRDGSFPLLGDSSPSDTCLRFAFADSAHQHLAYWVQRNASHVDLPVSKPLSLDIFAAAGYAILREEASSTHLVFDFGPWSRCTTTNHGHSDALSFELHAGGRPWIVDSGFFHPWSGATADLEWSRFFRSSPAHNTLLIDGREPFELSDYGDLTRPATTRLVGYRSDSGEAAVCGETQPCWSGGKTVHRREASLKLAGEVAIRDWVLLDPLPKRGNHKLQWFFHFAPDLAVQLSGKQGVVIQSGNEEVTCQVSCSASTPRLLLIRGQESPRQGWVAHSTAVVVPAWVLSVEMECSLSCEMAFSFRLAPISEGPRMRTSHVHGNA